MWIYLISSERVISKHATVRQDEVLNNSRSKAGNQGGTCITWTMVIPFPDKWKEARNYTCGKLQNVKALNMKTWMYWWMLTELCLGASGSMKRVNKTRSGLKM